jgi:hypothetical protein
MTVQVAKSLCEVAQAQARMVIADPVAGETCAAVRRSLERDADLLLLASCDPARLRCLFRRDDQDERVGNAEWACDLKASPTIGNVSDGAINHSGSSESDLRAFQGALTICVASLIHRKVHLSRPSSYFCHAVVDGKLTHGLPRPSAVLPMRRRRLGSPLHHFGPQNIRTSATRPRGSAVDGGLGWLIVWALTFSAWSARLLSPAKAVARLSHERGNRPTDQFSFIAKIGEQVPVSLLMKRPSKCLALEILRP